MEIGAFTRNSKVFRVRALESMTGLASDFRVG